MKHCSNGGVGAASGTIGHAPMTPTTAMHPAPHQQDQHRLAQIAQARLALRGHGALATDTPLEPWIRRSWQRCLAQGQTPGQRVVFNPVSAPATAQALEHNRALLAAAQPVIHSLARAMADTRYFAILTDAQGMVINVHGPIDRHDPHAALIARVGLDLSERAVGTTAIGATLAELAPVWLHRGEHFFDDTSMYSCAGAPLFGPDGQCVGMLDLTGVNVPERRALKHLVTQSARSIENALTLALPHQLLLRTNWPGRVLGEDSDGLVCVDADGHITGANRAAADMLNLVSLHPLVHCSEVFAVPTDSLFDAARAQRGPAELPLWSGLRLQVLVQGSNTFQGAAGLRAAAPGHGVPLKDVETALIRKAVEEARGNVMEAARALGISRATVYRKLGKPRSTG
jgi:transcriptional regulator of acetoin/glycerol metabolism